jgi:hypothetical protein
MPIEHAFALRPPGSGDQRNHRPMENPRWRVPNAQLGFFRGSDA